MIQRFIRCPHCRLPHAVEQRVCPETGKAISTRASKPPTAKDPARESAPPSSRRAVAGHLLGKTIGGRYRVRGVLGEGGMGTVFEAEHIALGRSVAVKVLHATQAAKKDSIRRFQQEARAAGAIGHPNICGVIDLGTLDDGSPYIVMERLLGETLADRVASEAGLPFEDVIDILVQVLSGLVAAHEQQIVHRDIKPENIFLTTRVGCPPLVKILDFGVSKMTGPSAGGIRPEDLALTRTGMVMGTPYYMAPEQARGERDLDARVDLYACGVILYEALTGRRPFTALNYNALLLQILSTTPRPASERRPALPPAFDEVIAKAMARRREDRYATASDFQRDLLALRPQSVSRLSAAEVIRATPPPLSTLPWSVEAPSSVAIPIIFAEDTPAGLLAVDPTDITSRPPPLEDAAAAARPASGEKSKADGQKPKTEGHGPKGSRTGRKDDEDGEGDPTQRMASAKPRRS
jgi:serine/threonine protein kinase